MTNVSFGNTVNVDRVPGKLNQYFKEMIQDLIEYHFPEQTGLILFQNSSLLKTCKVELYISPETTFVSIQRKKKIHEFYIDHPFNNFANLMFQTYSEAEDSKTIDVQYKNSRYTIKREEFTLSFKVQLNDQSPIKCNFSLSQAKFFPNETE